MDNRSKDTQTLLNDYLKELYLKSMRLSYEELAIQARQDSLSYEQYLLELAEQEYTTRRNNRIERNLKESKIPLDKSIENFDLKRVSGKVRQQVRLLQEGHFTAQNENILAFGNPGSGKTHLLCAIGQELIRNGKRVYFSPCSLLVQDLQLSRILNKLAKYDALIIDDIGYVQQDRSEMEVLFTLLAYRYERRSVMITSNLPFSKWEQIFKDPMVTAAAIDRLVHHSVILELNISSYRMEKAKEKKTG